MNWIGVLFLLIPNAYADLRRKQILPVWTVLCAVAALLWQLWQGSSLPVMIAGALPGCLLLLIGYLKPDSVGMGDGLVICGLGSWAGAETTIELLFIACLLMVTAVLPGLLRKKIERKTALPFVPFLLSAALLYLAAAAAQILVK